MIDDVTKKKVLLIDDETNLTSLTKLNLEATGRYEVTVENDGLKAIETIQRLMPDVILLDIVMPDIEGSQIAGVLKSDSQLKAIPIIFLTATVTSEEIDHSGGMIGGNPFIAKPARIQQIIDVIEKHTK